jgi:hypothetical protein
MIAWSLLFLIKELENANKASATPMQLDVTDFITLAVLEHRKRLSAEPFEGW